jgi:hypothetical protein
MAGIEPATATLAGRARYLSCHPRRQASASLASTCRLHGVHAMGLSIIQPVREAFREGQFSWEINGNAPEGFSLGRLRASACSRLPGNHSTGQGSRKPQRRIRASGPLRRPMRGHVSMVSRWRKPGNCISGAFRDAVPVPGDGARIPAGAALSAWRGLWCGAALGAGVAGGAGELSVREACRCGATRYDGLPAGARFPVGRLRPVCEGSIRGACA